ncbi:MULTISPECIES: methionine ABC transporter ATP-binding protein [Bifidobacterium]|jgi:D-methionine transport system ATP-binding protein|uniref:methionine ABC transporter ATP-binding protein n=1 Tax=Bifidobacterium TaxID=1678 RepID=UPI002353C32D|nr:ATP-binding cassette domain-containing protein [Bifidobacterium tibiigranuli]MCH3975772.1 ATP-binding cassette domain-containing protein [Bifidobacterium tibiigranuli]MCH4189308.1 ATP-binding cassette domain-containing protein [Bifidobacterium tibiigranuli]MCH4203057.1 ATP-binding cassette domain-containing protein [Bifidobacterium tibiigranuli]MCH4274794.1 ATP-binding cassette domain-containing protein [Bifidobacterium tibiigranuli]MCI1211673.1 ATP-binding cassette domain-containing protei
MTNEPAIEIQDVTKTFATRGGTVTALHDVSLSIERGTIYGVIGHSGGGKSTLVRCVNGLERPTQGVVRVQSEDISALSREELRLRRKKIGMIFQNFNLLDNATVQKNIELALPARKLGRAKTSERVGLLLEEVGLAHRSDSYPSQLSGGQRQRVAIARAMANEPDILLCDEPTSALDPETTDSILELLRQLNETHGITIMLITHEMSVVTRICSNVAVINEGTLVERGATVDIFKQPKHAVTRGFVDSFFQTKEAAESLRSPYVTNLVSEGAWIVRFLFYGDEAYQAFISEASQKFGIQISIIYGSVRMIGSAPLGNLYVLVRGNADQLASLFQFARQSQVSCIRINQAGEEL